MVRQTSGKFHHLVSMRRTPVVSSEPEKEAKDLVLCPHCQLPLSEEEIRSILGQFGRAKWKKPQVSRFAKMTPEERKHAAKQASEARWQKARAKANGG